MHDPNVNRTGTSTFPLKDRHWNRSTTMTTSYAKVMDENYTRKRVNFAARYDNTGNIFIQKRDSDGNTYETYELAPGMSYSATQKMGEGPWPGEWWAKGSAGSELLDAEEG